MSEALKNTPPYTKATAQQAGWIWRIPLQNRAGNGYVYVAEQCSDDEATATLLKAINTKPTSEAKFVPFKTGMRKQCWKGNCIAVGLAAGFIEPLESTAIHLAMRGAAEFLQQLPNTACSPALIKEYNRKIRQDYEEVRDFIILHYSASQRGGSELWNYCANMPLPDSLLEKLEYFKALGNVPYANFPLFEGTSWRSLCEGMQIRPQHYSMLIEPMDYKTIKAHMMSYKKALQSLALKAPSHDEFLRQYCASPQPATG